MLSSSEILQLQRLQQPGHSTATLSAREPLALPLVFDRQMSGLFGSCPCHCRAQAHLRSWGHEQATVVKQLRPFVGCRVNCIPLLASCAYTPMA